jgi:hypothetical protein
MKINSAPPFAGGAESRLKAKVQSHYTVSPTMMKVMERMAERKLQFLAANDAIGHRAVAGVGDHAHHALFGIEDGREVLDAPGSTGVEEQSGN